jgi:hypothetical protein
MRWRIWLHHYLSGDPPEVGSLENAWARDVYNDQSVPINVLMNHSDCDGEIPANVCDPLADALEKVLQDTEFCRKTTQFIKGLRAAAAAGESVEFH